ncbi:MAG: protein kinase [Anaerolineae bacterium]|nr:protein kinase [Anaerolineae bacterium]
MANNPCFSAEDARARISDERYIIEEFIGEGGMACVYRARESGTPDIYALKLLKERFRRQDEFLFVFQLEATNMRDLQHPNIVRFYKFIVEDQNAYILMDYIDGNPLTKYIQRARATEVPFPIDEIVRIMAQVARAISHLHNEGFIHRDVKPGNVLLAKQDGKAYLTDLGIAGVQGVGFALSGAGTPSYMPYEQQEGGHKVDQTVDIYAFAVMLFEMFAGEKPYYAPSGISYEEARGILTGLHQSAPVPDVTALRPELPHRMNAIFHKALAKNPADRYLNVTELAQAIHHALLPMLSPDLRDFEHIEARVMPDTKTIQQATAAIRQQTRNGVIVGGIAVLVIVILVIVAISLNTQKPSLVVQATSPSATNMPSETPTLVPTSTNTVIPSDTPTQTRQPTLIIVESTNTSQPTATTIATTESPTHTPTATDTPISPTPTQTATATPTPIPVSLERGASALAIATNNASLNELVAYALREQVTQIPLRLGTASNGFGVEIRWADIGNVTQYGIAFRVQDEHNYLLFYVDAVEKMWRIEERILVETQAEDGSTTLENISNNPILRSGTLDDDLPTTLSVVGVDDTFTLMLDSETVVLTHNIWSTGAASLWLTVTDAFDDVALPLINTINIDLRGQDAIAAQETLPDQRTAQLSPTTLFIRDVVALASIVDLSENLDCDTYRIGYRRLLTHRQNLIDFFDMEELANSIAPIIDEGRIIDNRCDNQGAGSELDPNESVADFLDLDSALQSFLENHVTDE